MHRQPSNPVQTYSRVIAAGVAAWAIGLSGAEAALVQADYTGSGTDFTGAIAPGIYTWGMDKNPINNVGEVDVDGNGTKDFHESGTSPVDPADGLASNTDGGLFRWDYGGSPSRTSSVNLEGSNKSYTFEVGLNILPTGSEGSSGVFGVALEFGTTTSEGRLQWEIGRTGMSFYGGAAASGFFSPDALSASNVGYHKWRVAYDADEGEFWFYRDNQLLNLNGAAVASSGNLGNPSSTLIGDYTSRLGGDWELDYIALDTTQAAAPVAPVPEPTGLALMLAAAGCGAGVIHFRRNRP